MMKTTMNNNATINESIVKATIHDIKSEFTNEQYNSFVNNNIIYKDDIEKITIDMIVGSERAELESGLAQNNLSIEKLTDEQVEAILLELKCRLIELLFNKDYEISCNEINEKFHEESMKIDNSHEIGAKAMRAKAQNSWDRVKKSHKEWVEYTHSDEWKIKVDQRLDEMLSNL